MNQTQSTETPHEPLELGSDQDVAKELGISRCTVWRYADNGIIPQPLRISPGCSRFNMKAVRQAIAQRAADNATAKKRIGRGVRSKSVSTPKTDPA